jgi:hypothetical protein
MIKLKYVHAFVDKRYGRRRARHYFRRRGYRATALPGLPGSKEFMAAYAQALAEASLPPFPPPSSLPGGIMAKRGQDPNAVQPLIGVYLLLLEGRVVYVGSSLNMPRRVAEHRSNYRPFDQVFYIATVANQREALERVLIKAINPSQNRAH